MNSSTSISPNGVWFFFRAVHHDPQTQYRSNRKEYRIDRIERLDPSKKWFFVIFGRTDLRISLSKAKFDAEADFDVHSAVAPPKPHQIGQKLIFRSKFFRFGFSMFFRPPSVVQGWNFNTRQISSSPTLQKNPKIYRIDRIDRSDRAIDRSIGSIDGRRVQAMPKWFSFGVPTNCWQ